MSGHVPPALPNSSTGGVNPEPQQDDAVTSARTKEVTTMIDIQDEPELDDWGLPIRKRIVKAVVSGEDSDGEEQFEDAIETTTTTTKEEVREPMLSPDLTQTTPLASPSLQVSRTRPRTDSHSRIDSPSSARPKSSHSQSANSPASKTMARFASSQESKAALLKQQRERELGRLKAAWSDTVPKQKEMVEARLVAEQAKIEMPEKRVVTPRKTQAAFHGSPTPGQVEWEQDKGAGEVISRSLSAREKRTSTNTKGAGEDKGLAIMMDDESQSQIQPAIDEETQSETKPEPEETPVEPQEKKTEGHKRVISNVSFRSHADSVGSTAAPGASEWSHQQLAPMKEVENGDDSVETEDDWQAMPAYAPFNLYNDDGKLIAVEHEEDAEQENYNKQLGGAGKGYTRVQMDEDAQSATSMDENTAYLFKEPSSNLMDEDEEGRDMLSQMQTTKSILTETQRIAYVGIVRLGMIEVNKELDTLEVNRHTKKLINMAKEAGTMWSQKIMVRLYSHMEIESAEQVMIEQLADHGVQPDDLKPSLMINARIKNPMQDESATQSSLSVAGQSSLSVDTIGTQKSAEKRLSTADTLSPTGANSRDKRISMARSESSADKAYCQDEEDFEKPKNLDPEPDTVPEVQDVSEYEKQQNIELDIRWTILCDLFLILISDSIYDARSRRLLEFVGDYLEVSTLDICRFEKRITDALEMQEAANKEDWNEDDHMEERRKQNKKRRMVMMGIATVGGGLVIGLSAGLLAPLIGAGLAAGFTTFGVAGTGSFLAGAGGAAIITTTGVVTGSNIGFKASERRTGSVRTFEYRPLHNNKRVNLIVTVAGWLTGKVDDVRLPFSTVDPIMGDIYSVFWEPEMLQSMGDTINILATEALTQALQQILGSTILVALMAALQLPVMLTKLAYLIDNPWTVSLARADLAGLILADSLVDRNLGARPITLVGFSLGSRVIYACLRELAKRGQFGVIQNVYMFGSPMVTKMNEFTKILSVVSGRFVNGYATNDWILGYLFRATGGGVMKVAGLAPIDHPRIENYNVTEFVPGHMSYRKMMPRLLREVGWVVESDEFTEIEDPDPENHEKRQRELINEIEEARKVFEEKEKKQSRFGWFKKKKAETIERKDWEMYDEKLRDGNEDDKAAIEAKAATGILFDIEALQKEVAALAAEGIQVRELPKSTLPPMKIDLSSSNNGAVFTPERKLLTSDDRSHSAPQDKPPFAPPPVTKADANSSPSTKASSFFGFGSKSSTPPVAAAAAATTAGVAAVGVSVISTAPILERSTTVPTIPKSEMTDPSPSLSFAPDPSYASTLPTRVDPIDLNHNAWADEFDDDFGHERDIQMTFE